MSAARCPTCRYSFAIHDRDGKCPRWAAAFQGTRPHTRVYVRVGHKWPEYEGHILAYFPDCTDTVGSLVLVLDLTTGERLEVPLVTVQRFWTKAASLKERGWAADDLEMRLGEKVTVLRNFKL